MSDSSFRSKDHIQIHDTTYRIISKMSHGGMGEISLVQNVATGQFLALKHFFAHAFSCQEDCEEYWHREQEIMRIQSKSPVRAIQFIDAFTLPSITGEIEYYLLMEYVQGITLEEWMKQHSDIPDQTEIKRRISQIIIPLCHHLEYVHSQGIIHRDITPRNIMLVIEKETTIPILIDWGVAKQQSISHISRSISSTSATTIASIGNPPEVLAGLEPVIASDVYMVGYLLNYLLTGGQAPRPYREKDYILIPIISNSHVWPELSNIVSEMTQFESSRRIQPLSKVLERLQSELLTVPATFPNSNILIDTSFNVSPNLKKTYRSEEIISTTTHQEQLLKAKFREALKECKESFDNSEFEFIKDLFYTLGNTGLEKWFTKNSKLRDNPKDLIFGYSDLEEIEYIDLRGVGLSSLPESIGNFSNLKGLYLNQNQFSIYPAEIHRMKTLKFLDLSDNQITFCPESVGDLAVLEVLILKSNQLYSLPKAIENLHQLQFLNVSLNRLSNIATNFHNLKLLEFLILSSNQLTSLPESIGTLYLLQYCDLSSNQLISLPESIGKLININWLDLSSNQLISLPESIGNLIHINWLDLSSNPLISLPESIRNLHKLIGLNFFSNPRLTKNEREKLSSLKIGKIFKNYPPLGSDLEFIGNLRAELFQFVGKKWDFIDWGKIGNITNVRFFK